MGITKKKKKTIEIREINIDIAKDGRVETGPVKLGYDWAGLFVRGDDCIMLRELLVLAKSKTSNPITHICIDEFLDNISVVFGGTND